MAIGSSGLEWKQDELEDIKRLIYQCERDLGVEEGLPRRPWFHHMMYAPGFYTGYAVKTTPAVREAIEQSDLDEARRYVEVVAGVIKCLTDMVRDITRRFQALR